MYTIMKVKHIPFELSEHDEVLLAGIERDTLEDTLTDLGYGKSVTKTHTTPSGTAIRYKGRTNGVYVKYHHNKDLARLVNAVSTALTDSPAHTMALSGKALSVRFNNRTLGVIRVHDGEPYTYSLDTDWDDFFGSDALQVDKLVVDITEVIKAMDPYYATHSVEQMMSYASVAGVPR